MKKTDNTYRVALFGHRVFDGHRILDKYFFELLIDLMNANDFVEIYIGRNGEFDIYAATVVKRVQRLLGKLNNELICILPYWNKDIEYYDEYYDSVRLFEMHKCHPKGAITKRNRQMVEMSDLVICYVERETGGAYSAMKYAERLHKEVINLATYN